MFKKFMRVGLFILTLFLCDGYATSILNPKIKSRSVSISKKECLEFIKAAEKQYQIPENLLAAIAHVESRVRPWAVNAESKARYFKTKEDAMAYVESLKKRNVKNVAIGCVQININVHGKKFQSLDAAFDPQTNIMYGARLIRSLYDRFHSWDKAVRFYHTGNAKYNVAYLKRVDHALNRYHGKIPDQSEEKTKKRSVKVAFGPGVGIAK